MKSIKKVMFILFLIVVVFFVFYFLAFRETTWGGWDPTSEAALTLDSKELQWVDDFQKINDCKIDYIGLDNAFMEDSIIHVEIFCNKNFSCSQKLVRQGAALVKAECNSLLFSSLNKKDFHL